MSQSRLGSFIEAGTNTAIGYGINLLVQLVLYPMYGATFTFNENLEIGLVFMVVSIVRGFVLRRFFNAALHRAAQKIAGGASMKSPDVHGFPIEVEDRSLAVLPTDPADRKNIPIGRGFFDYFPAAIAEVSKVSKHGNDQHNPGQDMHWARGKSTDQIDTILRHLMERGSRDTDGMLHTAKAAWRVLALLQLELETNGAPMARGARK